MIIGHLPAGYVFSKLIANKLVSRKSQRLFVFVGVIGAIAPDFDMFYFHLIDNRQHHHHTYWSHYPILWLGLLLFCSVWLPSKKSAALLGLIFSVNGLIHMFLDSIVGDIWWFAPFVDKPFALFTVPALYSPWWLNFILHWSFALELFILMWAVFIWHRNSGLR
ncbi:hydrolase [Candidatus Thiomargarita nelsonii]|uniref:Hydrolase n=1 Tax=Candidatus Thiomargarita nelsonii TaxID=1003181 RepID=A0A0A6PBK4_9GAMM|nr:hydrolase [Candidatus Thiomargarita nelsonii]